MRKYSWFVVLTVAFMGTPQPSWADAIAIVASSPSILVDAVAGTTHAGPTATIGGDVLSNTIGAIDPVTGASATASASLRSSNTTNTFSGIGTTATSSTNTNAAAVFAGGHAQVQYLTSFDVNQPQQFDFSGVFNTNAPPTNVNRSAWEAELFVFPNGPNPATVFDMSGAISQLLSFSGILPSGRYRLAVSSVSDTSNEVAQTGTDFRFTIAFRDVSAPAPTPEPMTVLLIGAGFVAIVARRIFVG
jgi:hypothetical protein